MALSLVVLYIFVALAEAYTTFHPICTTPSTSINFVSSSGTRGTVDILWSCFFTIIACTWTVQHLNVPEQRDDRDPGWRGNIKWAFKRSWTTSKWMLVTIITPEVLISKTSGDLVAAKLNNTRFQEFAMKDRVPWNMTHSFFANMGGFVIRSHVPERFEGLMDTNAGPNMSELDRESSKIPDGAEPQGMEPFESTIDSGHRFSLPRKGRSRMESENHSTKTQLPYSSPYHLCAPDLLALRKDNLLSRLPYIPKSELNDKSQSDSLVRFLAVLQLLWNIIQVSVRHSRHLAISQLEIAVVAFSICAIILYGVNWEKPKGVGVPYTLLQYREEIPETVLEKIKPRNDGTNGLWNVVSALVTFMTSFGSKSGDENDLPGSAISNHFNMFDDEDEDFAMIGECVGLLFGGVVFGSIHIVAWNFIFPTIIERTLWRIASIQCTTIPLAFLVVIFLGAYVDNQMPDQEIIPVVLGIILFILAIVYIAARLFLLVEIFRTLCFLPPSAYMATWTTNIPHVA
ncbi:hypothetical protein BDZ45DRAFT_304592 [Acephala macrosclerotiorum]|nr:hypothetical protein BDZ45DRAFT_304592 [Acephala macrosclerotiorum]